MLSITRRKGQSFFIGDDVEVYISDVQRGNVKVSIDAPKEIKIMRKELLEKEKAQKEEKLAGE